MENNKGTVIIDLGTSKISIAKMDGIEGEFKKISFYDSFPSAGISKGRIVNPAKLTNALTAALASVSSQTGISGCSFRVNLPKWDVRKFSVKETLHLSHSTAINASDLEKLNDQVDENARRQINCEEEDIFGTEPQAFTTDDEMNVRKDNLVGMVGNVLEGSYDIYVGKSNAHDAIDKAFRDASIDKVGSKMCLSSIGDAILSGMEMERGIAVMDIGAGASSVSVYCDGALRHYASIPFGGNCITSDISAICSIEEPLAENIKCAFGYCMPEKTSYLSEKIIKITDLQIEFTAKYLSEIISARVREIVEALLYEIQLSGYAESLRCGLVLTGGCANILNICPFIKEISGYNTRKRVASRKRFEAPEEFFSTGAVTLAAIAENIKDIAPVSAPSYNSGVIWPANKPENRPEKPAKPQEPEKTEEPKKPEKSEKSEDGENILERFGHIFKGVVIDSIDENALDTSPKSSKTASSKKKKKEEDMGPGLFGFMDNE